MWDKPKEYIRRDLREHYPPPYKSDLVSDNTGANAAIMLIRTIVTCLDNDFYNPSELFTKNGEALFPYACMEVGGRGLGASERERLREQVDQGMARITGGLSFQSITEGSGNPMPTDFWQRREFLLFTRLMVTPDHLQSKMLVSEEPTMTTESLARESLLQWDGSKSLNETVASNYLGPSFDGRFRLCNFPVCVRVQYTPKDGACPKFTDIMADPLHMKNEYGRLERPEKNLDDGWFVARDFGDPITYRLMVVVGLRSASDQKDYARRYEPNGQYIPDQPPNPCVSHDWRLGEPGHSYMLYFVRSRAQVLDMTQIKEVVPQFARPMASRSSMAPPAAAGPSTTRRLMIAPSTIAFSSSQESTLQQSAQQLYYQTRPVAPSVASSRSSVEGAEKEDA